MEWLTKLWETFTYVSYIIKDTDGQQGGEVWRVRSERALSAGAYISMELSCCTLLVQGVHQPRSSPNPILGSYYRGLIICSRLIKSLGIGNRFNLQPLSLPRRSGEGLKVPTL